MKQFIKKFTNEKIIDKLIDSGKIVLIKGNYYLTREKEFPAPPFASGIFLGEKKKEFKPGFPLIEMIQGHTDKIVEVNDKSAWLFVCGRDVLKEGVVSGKENGPVLVLNQLGECLGYGEWRNWIVKNRLDIGDFLRREKRTK